MTIIVVARKTEPRLNGCLLRRDMELHRTGNFIHLGETGDPSNSSFFNANTIYKSKVRRSHKVHSQGHHAATSAFSSFSAICLIWPAMAPPGPIN